MPVPTIPEELIIHIFGYVEYDFKFLSECSLISPPFTVACQKRLFQEVEISNREYAAGLEACLRDSPHLACYVQRLRLTSTQFTDWQSLEDILNSMGGRENLPIWDSQQPAVLPQLLNRFNAVRSLQITGSTDLRWENLSPTLRGAIIRLLEVIGLEELVLQKTSLPRYLLSLPKQLKHLRLQPPSSRREDCPMFDPNASPLDRRKPTLERLTISNTWDLDTVNLNSLRQVLDLSRLKEVRAIGAGPQASQWVGRVVQLSTYTLETLEWDYPDLYYGDLANDLVHIPIPLGLKHLKVSVYTDRHGDSELAKPHTWALRALRELARNATTSSSLETVEIYQKMFKSDRPTNGDPRMCDRGALCQLLRGNAWLQFDSLLSKGHIFPDTKLIVSLCEVPKDEEVWSLWLQEMSRQMPRLFSQGKVEFKLPA